MSTFLKIVRYIFAILFIIIILPLYFLGIPLTAVSQTFVHRENIKEIINEPKIYEGLVDAIATSLTTMQDAESIEEMGEFMELFEEDSEFSENLERIITSDETRLKFNTIIDALYDWFEGKEDSLQFEVYLIEDEEVFKEMFTSVLMLRINNLPTCDDYSTENLEVGVMELECIPPYIDRTELEPIIAANLDKADYDEVMDGFKISSEQIDISDEDTVTIRGIYIITKYFPIVLLGTLLLLTILVILLIPGLKGGLITTSIIYLLGGIFYLLIASVAKLNKLLTNVATNVTEMDVTYKQMQELMNALIYPIIDKITTNLTIYSLISIAIGVILLILGIVIKKKGKIETNQSTPEIKEEKK
jgi:hypothetical protein